MMKISTWSIMCLAIFLIIYSSRLYMLQYHTFIETNCIKGQVSSIKDSYVIQCIACYNFGFPLHLKSTGYLTIDIQPPLAEKSTNSQLLTSLWMQNSCLDYQCSNLLTQSQSLFLPTQAMIANNFKLYSHNVFQNKQNRWNIHHIKYDNQISKNQLTFFKKSLEKLFGAIVSQQGTYSQSMALRFRYLVEKSQITQIYKPVVKLYDRSESIIEYFLFSLLVSFIFFFKISSVSSHYIQQNSRPPFLQILLCMGFMMPYFISILSFILMAFDYSGKEGNNRRYSKLHFMSLALYFGYILYGYVILAIFAVKLSLFLHYRIDSEKQHYNSYSLSDQITKKDVIMLIGLLIFNHYLIKMQSLTIMSPNFVFALTYSAKKQQNYMAVSRNKPIIQIEEMEEMQNVD